MGLVGICVGVLLFNFLIDDRGLILQLRSPCIFPETQVVRSMIDDMKSFVFPHCYSNDRLPSALF